MIYFPAIFSAKLMKCSHIQVFLPLMSLCTHKINNFRWFAFIFCSSQNIFQFFFILLPSSIRALSADKSNNNFRFCIFFLLSASSGAWNNVSAFSIFPALTIWIRFAFWSAPKKSITAWNPLSLLMIAISFSPLSLMIPHSAAI